MPEGKAKKPAARKTAGGARPGGAARPKGAAASKPARPRRPAAAPIAAEAKDAPVAPELAAGQPEAAPAARREARRPASGPVVTVLQYASGIGCPKRQKLVLRALGLRHPHHRVVRPDNPAVRGMVAAIPHLVRIVEDRHGA